MEHLQVDEGELVASDLISTAVTAAPLRYGDGATQTFNAAGGTIYVERDRPTQGEWYVDEQGQFCSFWPPSYRACYELRWIVDDAEIVGLRFTEIGRGSSFDGRFQ